MSISVKKLACFELAGNPQSLKIGVFHKNKYLQQSSIVKLHSAKEKENEWAQIECTPSRQGMSHHSTNTQRESPLHQDTA
jgi:hypothetical protein